MAKIVACRNCGSVDKAGGGAEGSFLIELVLWFFFIIPGIIYSLWRLTTKKKRCRVCGSYEIVPIESPEGRRIADRTWT